MHEFKKNIHLIYLKIISLMGPVKNDLCSKLRRRKSWGRRPPRRASQTARPSSGTWWPWWRPRWADWTNIPRTLTKQYTSLFLYRYLLFCHQAVQYPKDFTDDILRQIEWGYYCPPGSWSPRRGAAGEGDRPGQDQQRERHLQAKVIWVLLSNMLETFGPMSFPELLNWTEVF